MAARDRLAALRAQRLQGQLTSPTSPTGGAYEMSGLHTSVNGNGAGSPSAPAVNDGMPDFYGEVSSIDDMLSQFNSNVARISELHSRSLNSMDEALSKQNHAVLDELVASTRTLGNDLKNRIQNLEKQPAPPGQGDIRKNQTKRLRNQFLGALQKYQTVEQDYRRRYRERVERQFKIVKPEATPEEVSAVVNDDNGAGGQVFSQALMSSTRYGESRAAYREVQERHEDIRKIEHTLTELAQLFNDMSILIEQQDEAIKGIETAAEGVAADTEAGLTHTEKAVKSARAARKKRWICFFIILIILAVVGIVVGVVVSQNVNKK